MSLTSDLREEQLALFDLMKGQSEEFYQTPSQFKDWTVWDIIAHLHFSDHMALTAATSDEAFYALQKELGVLFAGKISFRDYARNWAGDISGQALLERWNDMFNDMCGRFDDAPDGQRYKWFGPDMGVRMFATARQMEIWAHGQAIYDLLGITRQDTDRIKNIVVIGVKTFGFNFTLHGKEVPATMPFVSLTAPSGEIWAFGEENTSERIEGQAIEFAQVVTQTRNIKDTDLMVTGEVASNWMEIAQCFAGGAETPPAPGQRHKSENQG
ncbi:TIGR03084 family metal-binding protein [Kordiimonas sp. SCSIO 12610]|uniref:TIGR03084 family metal-binding protein n=1 Tax=Kordiimonas sp. SCSIO 12610 TaxID=2829597 RepID=UPI00210AD460|nr:TIGR03084 family metal-binding protein [Kordiimonas sp. SCSIO 12610]UTW54766.1 TIGR03084 family protein [Kordiimonas sp. SCSIO 12610]